MQWALMGRRVLRRVLRRGSKKGLSRRQLEGRSTPFREYDPLGVRPVLESVSTGVWRVPGFSAGFEMALEPSELQKEGENPGKGCFYFLRQTLVCTKPWFKERSDHFRRCQVGRKLGGDKQK